jgi:hypothetical protein
MPRNYVLRIRGPADGVFSLIASAGAFAFTGTAATLTDSGAGGGLAEPEFDSETDDLIDDEDFDGFDSFANAGATVMDKYVGGRCIWPGNGSGNNDLQNAATAAEAEDDGIITLVTGRGGTGKAIEFVYAGSTGASDVDQGARGRLDNIGDLDGTLPEVAGPYTHLAWTVWFKASVGAQPAGSNSSSLKGFMQYYGSGSARVEWRPCVLASGSDNHGPAFLSSEMRWQGHSRWQPGGGWPSNEETMLNSWKTTTDMPFIDRDGYPPIWSPDDETGYFNDGTWHRFTLVLRQGPSVADGDKGMAMWLDGHYVFDCRGEVPLLTDIGQGVGINPGGNPWGGGLAYPFNETIQGPRKWGTFVTGAAAAATTQFTVAFDDERCWIPG